jgi:formylmethanofuran dehydrogenase subunit B
MNESQSLTRFCTFCSLLCQPPVSERDFGETFCSRRNRELDRMGQWHDEQRLPADATMWESVVEKARSILARSESTLVTGRIHTVDSARAAVRLARRSDAVLDFWESDTAFEAIEAMQRSGSYTVSLAEARDHASLLVVIGSDALVEDYPRLPFELANGHAKPLLLLGEWSERARKPWLDAGFQAIAVPTSIPLLPRSLTQAVTESQSTGWDSQVGAWLQQSMYTTVLWSMRHLDARHGGLPNGDLWFESMMQWVAARNETHRCAALVWSGLEGTFQQVCTWLTGFPGRVRFRAGEMEYDPWRFAASRWVEDRYGTEQRQGLDALVWIDDSAEDLPPHALGRNVSYIAITPTRPDAGDDSVLWLPCHRAGVGSTGEFFRGDQTILVRGCDPSCTAGPSGLMTHLPSAGDWLRELLRS